MSGDVVNLRRERKRRARTERAAEAAVNRTAFGTPKAARALAAAEHDLAERRLTGHRIASVPPRDDA